MSHAVPSVDYIDAKTQGFFWLQEFTGMCAVLSIYLFIDMISLFAGFVSEASRT